MQKLFFQSLGLQTKQSVFLNNGLVLTPDTQRRLGVAEGSVWAQVKLPIIVATDKQL